MRSARYIDRRARRFWVYAHTHDVLEGFTLGGELELDVRSDHTLATLRSPAPIFLLDTEGNALGRLLVDEVEALAAIERAEWNGDDQAWFDMLSHVEPLQLFVAVLATLHRRLQRLPKVLPDVDHRQADHAVLLAIQAAEGGASVARLAADARRSPGQPLDTRQVSKICQGHDATTLRRLGLGLA